MHATGRAIPLVQKGHSCFSWQTLWPRFPKVKCWKFAKPLFWHAKCVHSQKKIRPFDKDKLGSLPIPSVCNEVLCLYVLQMDLYNGFDYVLTLVDNLPHFCQFIPTQKSVTGEGVLTLILERWISVFGKPEVVRSDNDVRFRQSSGFYQSPLRRLT